jgi:putative ABC transport system permease protein
MISEIRHAFRSLARTPSFTAIVLVTLALGLGVNTSMYTLVDVLLLRTVPFAQADRLLSIVGTTPQTRRDGFSFAEIDEIRAQAAGPGKAFETVTAFSQWNNTLAEPGKTAERLLSLDATADFFDTFRIQPMLGRAYTRDEEVPGRNQVVILSYSVWQSRFAGDPNILGRSIRLNAEQVNVIGVMPRSFVAPLFFGPVTLWRPITIPPHIVNDRGNRFFAAIGRLNPGVTPEQALAQLKPLAVRWAHDYPQTSKDRGFILLPPHKAAMDSTSEFMVWLLFGLGGAVLLVACANIANLQLARSTGNMHELAVRSALGASRARLILHQLAEPMVLALCGGLFGVLVAGWMNALLGSTIRIGFDASDTLALPMNGRVLLVAFLISLLTGLLFGLLPAWFASSSDVVSMLRQKTRASTSGRGPRLLRNALIVGEITTALAVLGVACVMVRGMDTLLKRDKGWDMDRLVAANIHLPEQSTYITEDKRRVAIDKLVRRLAQIPGAEHTAVCSTSPYFDYSKVVPIQIEGQAYEDPSKQPNAGYTMVTSEYFATLGIPLIEGRVFPADLKADSAPVVVINETMARRFWPGRSAVGRRFADRQGDKLVWREVVGVVRDIQFALNVTSPSTMYQVYKPLVNEPWGYLYLLVRGRDPARFKNDLRRAVTDVDPDVAVQELYTVPEAIDFYEHNIMVVNGTVAGFALLGLLLAAVGLYGVVSYLVAQRTNEIGIRIALGASWGDVLGLIMRHGVLLTLIGLVLGLGAGYGLNRLVGSMVPLMVASDPAALAVTAAALFAVAMVACWVPARRATKINPLDAIRTE